MKKLKILINITCFAIMTNLVVLAYTSTIPTLILFGLFIILIEFVERHTAKVHESLRLEILKINKRAQEELNNHKKSK